MLIKIQFMTLLNIFLGGIRPKQSADEKFLMHTYVQMADINLDF